MYVACIILLLDTVMLHGSSLYNIAYSINVSYNQKKCKFSWRIGILSDIMKLIIFTKFSNASFSLGILIFPLNVK